MIWAVVGIVVIAACAALGPWACDAAFGSEHYVLVANAVWLAAVAGYVVFVWGIVRGASRRGHRR